MSLAKLKGGLGIIFGNFFFHAKVMSISNFQHGNFGAHLKCISAINKHTLCTCHRMPGINDTKDSKTCPNSKKHIGHQVETKLRRCASNKRRMSTCVPIRRSKKGEITVLDLMSFYHATRIFVSFNDVETIFVAGLGNEASYQDSSSYSLQSPMPG